MSNFSLDQLTEGIRERHLGSQNRRLLEKWSRTGLLRGLDGVKRENMARMLENQASQVLKEASDLGAGTVGNSDIRGFSNIAFPIVRRVFGGLIANDLVSIQPMSLPSGLLFYLDYTYGDTIGAGGDADRATDAYTKGDSIYSNPKGKGVRSGSFASGGQYDLAGAGYTRARIQGDLAEVQCENFNVVFRADTGNATANTGGNDATVALGLKSSGLDARWAQFDPQLMDLIDDGEIWTFYAVPVATIEACTVLAGDPASGAGTLDRTMVREVALIEGAAADGADIANAVVADTIQAGRTFNIRRLNQLVDITASGDVVTGFTANPINGTHVLMVVKGVVAAGATGDTGFGIAYVRSSSVDANSDGSTLTVPGFESDFTAGVNDADDGEIPEIDIKIESIAVTAITRKLRAKWTPELAQDLNAYHSLDAEVELTQILSEQIALEIDREILGDLLHSANAANLYWSRAPGKFVNKNTGVVVQRATTLDPGPAFTGTVREWYETFVETIIDVANQIHRKTLRGSANFIVVGPDVATILEASVLYRPSYSLDGEGQVSQPMSIGAEKVGTLSNRFTVYKDPYFPRNKVLVGYKGGSYLESGYVYAPYVPLIVTPTIFAPEDFTPRKGVMTRYGKKMVRSDFFGTVTVMDLNVI